MAKKRIFGLGDISRLGSGSGPLRPKGGMSGMDIAHLGSGSGQMRPKTGMSGMDISHLGSPSLKNQSPFGPRKKKKPPGGEKPDEPDKPDDPPNPDDPTKPPVTPTTPTYVGSNNWPDIVAHYFPKGAGTYFKDGGLVRGGGKAQKGRGRGRIV